MMFYVYFVLGIVSFISEGDVQSHGSDFSFASYYGDNMVLQGAPYAANVWGYSTKMGDTVTVTVEGKPPVQTNVRTVDGRGMWLARLPIIDASDKPFIITAKSSLGSIVLNNVLFGDVWICSGQSNMQFTMAQVDNSTEELQEASNYPNIRVFTAQLNQSNTPLYDLLSVEEPWSVPNAGSVGNNPWTYFSAVCWLYGKYLSDTLKKPIGLVASSWGGTRIETWSTEDSLSKCRKQNSHVGHEKYSDIPNKDSVLWNAMMHPFLNMTVYGAIWYQGEANAADPVPYNCTFPAMIDDWREKFNQGSMGATNPMFPFGFVQLAGDNNNHSIQSGFPDIRWYQTASYGYVPNDRMRNVFMAVAMDLPDFKSPYGSVHPRDKQDVCQRLVRSGLHVAYNYTQIVFQGPRAAAFIYNTEQHYAVITYDAYGEGIQVRSNDGFEICCSDRKTCEDPNFVWTQSPINSSTNSSVTVNWMPSCDKLTAIRYSWRESPCAFKKCAVYSAKNELPAPPFVFYFQK